MQFEFRRLSRPDFGQLSDWLSEAHVRRWWNHDPSPVAVEDDFGPTADGQEPAEDYVVEYRGEPIGVIQFCMFSDYPEYVDEMRSVYPVGDGDASIDYFIGRADLVGMGIGRAMIAAFAQTVWATKPAVQRLVVPVNSSNVASWRALLSAGFELVARGDMVPDNPVDRPLHEILQLARPT